MRQNNRINWRNGNGEIIGFAACVSLLFLLVVSIMVFTAYTIRNQQLTVAAYCAGRAAAVSQTYDLGEKRAAAVLDAIYTEHEVKMEIKKTGTWKKGNLFTIELSQEFPYIFPFADKTLSCNLTMMIEGSPPRGK